MQVKKIKIMASFDWSLRYTTKAFVEFLDPVLHYKGNKYKLELGRVIAEPTKCGENLNHVADFLVDRTIHWNDYFKCWAQQAIACQMKIANHAHTFQNLDKHSTYDLMARAIHPKDHFPTTVLLPQFYPYNEDQERQQLWEMEQKAILANTHYGFDKNRAYVDMDKVRKTMERNLYFHDQTKMMRDLFYKKGNYLQEAMEKYFGNRYPVFLKKAFGGGGSDVYKIHSLEELYQKYDETAGRTFHIQEAVENYDTFVRCMALGPQILPMRFQPDHPHHEHYSPEKLRLPSDLYERLANYVMLINAYHRWTYNSFEALLKDNRIYPIDFANACPDSHFTSLHVHFPWLICASVKWFSFCAVAVRDMGIDLQQEEYLSVLNDPNKSQEEKYALWTEISQNYFEMGAFEQFCQENFPDIDEKMVQFYDRYVDNIIGHAIEYSEFPHEEREYFFHYYKNMMEKYFRANAKEYLTTFIPA